MTTTPREGDGERERMERKHVFVVNSEPALLDLVRELLQDASYNVTTTNFVPETFGQIAALRPSILIVDLAVGQRAGWDLLERLQDDAVTRGIPVVVVSTDPALLARAKGHETRYGERMFVAKPFDIDDLVESVRSLVGPA